ncbi:alpha/beta hydrolase [Oceaniglobus trochenteri]|uniref:alpha/beta hydrolase n=1 Tax=Oceaniglobus trochenteri TaxID=2763260 RepID=UPI001CFF58C1|nr:alpha/beta hydrolase [Oceaniglobus trochenteri]
MSNDIAYANRDFIPGADAFPPKWAAAAEQFRAKLLEEGRARLDQPYGSRRRQGYDMFLPEGAAKGVVIFVHGGYWRLFDRKSWSHLAAGALRRGYVVAMPSYTLAPEVRIAEITREIATAVRAVAEVTEGPIRLAGHSAGGHLVARMMCRDVDLGHAEARVVNCVAISPVVDLRPLIDTAMNADLRLDQATAAAESPCLMRDIRDVPVAAWVGGDERPAFLDQARWLAEAWPTARLHVEKGQHHFDVIEPLEHPDSPLTGAVLA